MAPAWADQQLNQVTWLWCYFLFSLSSRLAYACPLNQKIGLLFTQLASVCSSWFTHTTGGKLWALPTTIGHDLFHWLHALYLHKAREILSLLHPLQFFVCMILFMQWSSRHSRNVCLYKCTLEIAIDQKKLAHTFPAMSKNPKYSVKSMGRC